MVELDIPHFVPQGVLPGSFEGMSTVEELYSEGEALKDQGKQEEAVEKFLAVLEMVRLQMIVVFQRKMFGEIRIAHAPERLEPSVENETGDEIVNEFAKGNEP